MVRPLSEDLRRRVVGRVEAGHSVREVAETFGVSAASVVRWSQRKRQTGTVAAKPMGSRRARSLASQRDWMLRRLEAKPI
jgi:transposase